MRRLLMLAGHFYPSSRVGAHRPSRWLRHLEDSGWQTDVLTFELESSTPQDPKLLDWIPSGTRITRVKSLALTERIRSLGRVARSSAPADSTGGVGAGTPASVDERRSRSERLAGWVSPIDSQLFDQPLVLRTGHKMAQEADCVLVTAPPFSLIPTASRLSTRHELPLVVDLRDPWTPGPTRRGVSRFHARLERWLEHRSLAKADAIVVTTDEVRSTYLREFPELEPSRVHVIQNGFDPEDFVEVPGPPPIPPVRVGHFGTVYRGRDPRPLVRALEEEVRSGRIPSGTIELHFFGADTQGVLRSPEVAASQHVAQHPSLPLEEAVREMGRCHVLLLLTSDRHPDTIPAKLYEYIGVGRPVLAICRQDATARWMRGRGFGRVCAPDHTDEVVTALRELASGDFSAYGNLSESERQRLTRESEAQSLIQILGALVPCNRDL